MPNWVPVTPSGQQVAGSQYPGLLPLSASRYAGQEPLVGSSEVEPEAPQYIPIAADPEPVASPERDHRLCRWEAKECNGWRGEDDYCVGHRRAAEKLSAKESDGPTGDEGLH